MSRVQLKRLTQAKTTLETRDTAARLEGLTRESASGTVMSRQELIELLSSIARGEGLATAIVEGAEVLVGPDSATRLKAAKQLAQLEGWEKQTEAVQDSGITELSRHFQAMREDHSKTKN